MILFSRMELKNMEDVEKLMDSSAYEKYLAEEE